MTEFIIKGLNLDKWIHQNAGECVECVEGCLLDNLLVMCRRGAAYIFEEYVNPSMSRYRVFFVRYGCRDARARAVEGRWQKLADMAEMEA